MMRHVHIFASADRPCPCGLTWAAVMGSMRFPGDHRRPVVVPIRAGQGGGPQPKPFAMKCPPGTPCPGWRGPCPAGATRPEAPGYDLRERDKKRGAAPWRCPKCSRRREGERRRGAAHWTATKTHCPQGHPYSGENLIVWVNPAGRPRRYCRICNDRYRKRWARLWRVR